MAEQRDYWWDAEEDPNTGDPDREYSFDSFAEVLDRFFASEGYLPPVGDALEVRPSDPPDMTTVVQTGALLALGKAFLIDGDAGDGITVTHDPADGSDDRIDRVVIRVDYQDRVISAEVLTGTPAADPDPPSVQRDTARREYSLAQVHVRAGATQIVDEDDGSQAYLSVDERDNTEVCGAAELRLAEQQLESSSEITLHVDDSNGDDAHSGSESAPLATFAEAISRVPLVLRHDATIHLVGATHSEDDVRVPPRLAVDATLTIQGDETEGGTTLQIAASGGGGGIVVMRAAGVVGLRLADLTFDDAVELVDCHAELEDCETGAAGSTANMTIRGGYATVTDCTPNVGLMADEGATVVASGLAGFGAVRARGGSLVVVTDDSSIDDVWDAEHGSRIIHDGQLEDPSANATYVEQLGGTIRGYVEPLDDPGASGTVTLDLSQHNVYDVTPTGTIDFAFSGLPSAGDSASATIIIRNDTYAVTWPAGTRFPDGEAPELDGETWLVVVAVGSEVTVFESATGVA